MMKPYMTTASGIVLYSQQTVDDEIYKIIHMLDSVIKCWRMTEPNDPARAMVRAAGSAMVDKHKNAKSHQNKVDL